jgi:hypothetical protein
MRVDRPCLTAVAYRQMHMIRMANGKGAEHWAVRHMVAFTAAVARLRETQHRAAQAAAARRAAEQLQQCRHLYSGPAAAESQPRRGALSKRSTPQLRPRHAPETNVSAPDLAISGRTVAGLG